MFQLAKDDENVVFFLKDPKKTIRVKQSGETLQEWEAAGRKAKWESSEKGSERAEPTDERAAIVCAAVRGSQHDKRTIDALENLLGKQVMKVESIVRARKGEGMSGYGGAARK